MDYPQIYEYELGVRFTNRSGSNWQGHCPLPDHDDGNASFSIHIETGQCQCFGCGFKGNAITMAKALNHINPHKFIENNNNGHIRRDRPIKSENRKPTMTIEEVEKKKEEYFNNLPDDWKKKSLARGKDFGMTKDKRLTFHYPTAIKVHKSKPDKDGNQKPPYWIGIDKHCQMYGLDSVDLTKPVTIVEGEKDSVNLCGMINEISFSHGAGKVPSDLSALKGVPEIIVLGDNDDAGRKHNQIVAHQFYLMGIPVKIATWHNSLADGYDPTDDIKENKAPVETSIAIDNAVDYVPSTTTETKDNNQIGDFDIMDSKTMRMEEPKKVEWFVEGILPKKFNSVMAGTTGSKKSLWAMQLGLSLANGEREFCGGKIDKQYKILYVDTECGRNEFIRRYQNIIKHMNWRGDDYFKAMSRHGRMKDIWDDVMEVVMIYEPDLLIIDCLYNSTSVNEFSKGTSMSKVTDSLSDFKVLRGVTTLAVHHFIKGGHDQLHIDRMSGASALQNWVEYCMLMVQSNREDLNLWKIGKARGVGNNQNVYGLRWDDFKFRMDGIIEDISPFMIDKHSKNKYATILEDLPNRFDRKDWINVFSQRYDKMNERTGDNWLKKCLEARMVKKIANGVYEKYLRLINEENVNNE